VSTEDTRADGEPPGRAGASESDAQELLARLRSAPAEEIVAELFSTLLSTAQVKLGRRDARLFIDLGAQTLEYAGRYLPDDLGRQVEQALGQLRLAQVSAESEVSKNGEPEPNDLPVIPRSPAGERRADPGPRAESGSPASKLWVPGR
jgi:hypothetical protein